MRLVFIFAAWSATILSATTAAAQMPERAELEQLVELQPGEILVQAKNGCYYIDEPLTGRQTSSTDGLLWGGGCLYGLANFEQGRESSFYFNDLKPGSKTYNRSYMAGIPSYIGYMGTEYIEYFPAPGRALRIWNGPYRLYMPMAGSSGFGGDLAIDLKQVEMAGGRAIFVPGKSAIMYFDRSNNGEVRAYFYASFEVEECPKGFTATMKRENYASDPKSLTVLDAFTKECEKWKSKPGRMIYGSYTHYLRPHIGKMIIYQNSYMSDSKIDKVELCDIDNLKDSCFATWNSTMAAWRPKIDALGVKFLAREKASSDRQKRIYPKVIAARDNAAQRNAAKQDEEDRAYVANRDKEMAQHKAKFGKMNAGDLYMTGVDMMQSDDFDFAREAFSTLIRRFPDHALVPKALERIEEIDASGG